MSDVALHCSTDEKGHGFSAGPAVGFGGDAAESDCLRYSAALLLLAHGGPVKVVGEMLGHADAATTLRIYAHVLEGAQEQAASYMERLFHP